MTAVPAEVNCAVPISAGAFKQYGAAALQKITVPAVTGDPLDTVAVKTTTVPEVTEETGEEEAASASVVVVAVCACATGAPTTAAIAIIAADKIHWRDFRCTDHDPARIG
jgi:hypothetical protein